MPTRQQKSQAHAAGDVLAELTPDVALDVVRILAHDDALAERIREAAATLLSASAPRDLEEVHEWAEGFREDLESLAVEDLWERSGRTREGYVEPGEAADDMVAELVDPIMADVERHQRLGMARQAAYRVLSLVEGFYRFEAESSTEFKEWATDVPVEYAHDVLTRWRRSGTTAEMLAAVRALIAEHLPGWSDRLLDLLRDDAGSPT